MKKMMLSLMIPVIAVAAVLIYLKTPSKTFEQFPAAGNSVIIYEGRISGAHSPLNADGRIYLPYMFIKEYIDEDIFFDSGYGLVTILYNDELIRLSGDAIIEKNDTSYISSNILKDIYPLSISETVSGITIKDERKEHRTALAIQETYIRHDSSIKSAYMDKAYTGQTLYIIDVSDEWLKVWTIKGSIGYVLRKDTAEIRTAAPAVAERERTPSALTDKKVFVWEMMYSIPEQPENMTPIQGIDIISPTWLQLMDKEGRIRERIAHWYARKLQEEGILIFPCVTNDFNDPDMTAAFLEDPYARERFITDLADICNEYGFQGINIDFENIYYSKREHFTQFIRELSHYLGRQELVLTVCTGVTGGSLNYSLVYDHKKIGEFADYIMLMSYDELPYSGTAVGPVASLEWLGKKVEEILALVDPCRLYLGIPLYTRVWNVNDENHYTSIPVSIIRQEQILTENAEGILETDEVTGQSVFRYHKNETDYLMYIENTDTMKKRLDIINRFNIAGAAFWAKNYVEDDFFIEIKEQMKKP